MVLPPFASYCFGKTTLVHRFALEAEAAGGMFVFGKAAINRSSTPFAAVTAALDMLVKKSIAEAPEDLKQLDERITGRMGPDMPKALPLTPALSYLVGNAAGPELPAEALQGLHANSLIHSLLEIFADRPKGLVFFLDDLQWLDTASIKLLSHLAVAPPIPGLLLVLGFRSQDHATFPGIAGLLKTCRENEDCLLMKLKGLSRRDITAYIRDRLGTRQDVKPLSELCFEKTHGNPLYLIRLMDDLLAGGAVSPMTGSWRRWKT